MSPGNPQTPRWWKPKAQASQDMLSPKTYKALACTSQGMSLLTKQKGVPTLSQQKVWAVLGGDAI